MESQVEYEVTETPTNDELGPRRTDWFWLDNVLIDDYSQILKCHGIAVYATLCRFANNETRTCFPAYSTIAERAGCSRSMAIKMVNLLCECNIISKTPRTNPVTGDPTSNLYGFIPREQWIPASALKHLECKKRTYKKRKDAQK